MASRIRPTAFIATNWLSRISRFGQIPIRSLSSVKGDSQNVPRANESSTSGTGSLFGDFTTPQGNNNTSSALSNLPISNYENHQVKRRKDFSDDPEVLELNTPKALSAAQLLLSTLKRRLYEKNVQTYGKYKPDQLIELDGKTYQLKLTKQEVELFEPSVYLKSYRIKGSPKKGTIFTRFLRGMELKKAITQCHFSQKKLSRDIGDMLSRGLEQAKELNLPENDLYISQIWVGKDPGAYRRVDIKSRGRNGLITHKYIHVRAILKTSVTKERIANEKVEKEAKRKVWTQHHNRNIYDFPGSSQYKW